MDPNAQNNQPTAPPTDVGNQAGGQVPPQTPQQGVVQPAQTQPVQPQTVQQAPQNPAPVQPESQVAVPQQESTQTIAQQQSSSNMFSQTGDSSPVPAQSVPQPNTPVEMPPPPKKKGGILKALLMLFIILIILGVPIFGGLGYAVATDIISINPAVDSQFKNIASNFGIGSDTESEDETAVEPIQPADVAEIPEEDFVEPSTLAPVPTESETDTSSDVANIDIIADAILEYYTVNDKLPDTNNDPNIDDFPVEWTCIGRAPQCYDLEEAGAELDDNLIPFYLGSVPIATGGHSQNSGYELMLEVESSIFLVRSASNNQVITSRNLE